MKATAMSLTFYFTPYSTASVTQAVLAELGTPCERIELSIGAGGTRTPEFLRVNPNGRVPTIVHDGTAIWESSAITLYLGEMFGVEKGLYPAPGPKRGEAMKWIIWANMVLAEAGGRLSAQMDGDGATQEESPDWLPAELRSEAAALRARADITANLDILERTLDGKDFLLGNYSLVDTHMQGFAGWLAMLGTDYSGYPGIAAWLGRCAARPALAALMTDNN
jgi:glutathione S-transferase